MKSKKGNPFQQGQEARRLGLTKKRNPYGTASREWSRWNCGWDAEELRVRHIGQKEGENGVAAH